jgi:hypothetical protein
MLEVEIQLMVWFLFAFVKTETFSNFAPIEKNFNYTEGLLCTFALMLKNNWNKIRAIPEELLYIHTSFSLINQKLLSSQTS